MSILEKEIDLRDDLARKYTASLYTDNNVICPTILDGNRSAWAQYTLRVTDREAFQEKMKSSGVPTAVHYPLPLNKQPAVRDIMAVLPIGEKISGEVVSLPMHAYMSDLDFEKIVNTALG